jgi:hypothetical protein
VKICIGSEVIIVKDWAEMTTYERLRTLKMVARIEAVLVKIKRPAVSRNNNTGSKKIIFLPYSVPAPVHESNDGRRR